MASGKTRKEGGCHVKDLEENDRTREKKDVKNKEKMTGRMCGRQVKNDERKTTSEKSITN